MIIHYKTNGTILGYSTFGGAVPEDVPSGEAYLIWRGIEPKPIKDYEVINEQVVLKSEAIRQTSSDAQQLRHIRGLRDKLLLSSDYVILPDAPYSEDTKTAYRTYRQALRDVPAQADIYNVIWPEKP